VPLVTTASLIDLLGTRQAVALTGAGCSTDSGIPDYRSPGARPRAPLQHRAFVTSADARVRYWARSTLGWPRFSAARPNATHAALAALERRGHLAGVITQNVDSLHDKAGSQGVVELHGALARVRCLDCNEVTSRDELQRRLLDVNPGWMDRAHGEVAPDGDVELEAGVPFHVVPCAACGGVVMPDVVFFGGSVARATLDAAWALFDRAELLLVLGSSLAVFSGYRFVRRAAERGVPIVIVNRGETRGDAYASLRIDAPLAPVLAAVSAQLS
jgi:NAD-dependent SIR2 family protein deacetylase